MLTCVDNIELDSSMFNGYLATLVNQFFKVLPIRESGEPTLKQYLKSLQREMLGCKTLIVALDHDDHYLSLLSILQYHIDNDCTVDIVKSDVFKAIGILKRLQAKYSSERRC